MLLGNNKSAGTPSKNFLYGENINVKDYNNDITVFAKYSARYVGTQEFDWDQLEISDRRYQTRVADADKGHIAALAADIESVGLKTLPVVEFDKDRKKYCVLSGFHRMLAMRDLSTHSSSGFERKYPAIVVEFSDDRSRWDFLQHCNNHRPAKPHGKADAIMYIKTLKKAGGFDHLSKEKDKQDRVYDLLSKYYPRIRTSSKRDVWEAAFGLDQIKRIKTWTTPELSEEVKKLHSTSYRSGQIAGDVCYVNSDYNSARKAIYVACVNRAVQISKGEASKPLTIKVTTFAQKSVSCIKEWRQRCLDELTISNTMVWGKTVVGLIEEIVFLHQVLAPSKEAETIPIKYTWNAKCKKFI